MNIEYVKNFVESDEAVSPVVGVILMVAVTVILAAVIGTFVLDLGQSTEKNVSAGITMSESSEGVEVRWITSGNADTVTVLVNGETVEGAVLSGIGDSVTVTAGEGDIVSVIGESDTGESNVVTSTQSDTDTTGGSGESTVVNGGESSTSTSTVTGTVLYNPTVEGATVDLYSESGELLGSAMSDSNGEYSIEYDSAKTPNEVVVSAVDKTHTDGTTFHAGAAVPVSGETVDVTFNEDTSTTVSIDGEESYVFYGAAESSSTTQQIANLEQLQGMAANPSGNYELVTDIDASSTQNWNTSNTELTGFEPVGTDSNRFSGTLDGNGHSISELYISGEDTDSRLGLFGYGDGATVQNLEISGTVSGEINLGLLFGQMTNTDISNIQADSTVTSDSSGQYDSPFAVGGLVGQGEGQISDSDVTVQMNVRDDFSEIGGLLGTSYSNMNLSNTSTSGNINVNLSGNPDSTYYAAGGLAGGLFGSSSTVIDSSSSVDITVSTGGEGSSVGGLVSDSYGTIDTSYATGNIDVGDSNGFYYGGLVSNSYGNINDSYATGDVIASGQQIGGFAGASYGSEVNDSYATGDVQANSSNFGVGGFIGENTSNLTNTYWDTSTSSQTDAIGDNSNGTGTPTGLTTSEMTGEDAESNMTGFDWTSIWTTGDSYPELE